MAALASLRRGDPLGRIALVRQGIPAHTIETLADALGLPKEKLYAATGIARATADRKIRAGRRLSAAESEGVLGVTRLVELAQRMWEESGDHEGAPGFDPARWLGGWLDAPSPALGGGRPAAFLDTAEGRDLVYQLLGSIQAGTYW